MKQFDALGTDAKFAQILGAMKKVDAPTLSDLADRYPAIPDRFLRFLADIGWGEIGSAGYMIYSGPALATDIFGDVSGEAADLILFGDGFAGFAAGFDNDGRVKEVQIGTWEAVFRGGEFGDFIIEKIDDAVHGSQLTVPG